VTERPDDELVREVFVHFGLAAYLAQVLERGLVNALTSVYGPEPYRLSQAELDQRFEALAEGNPGALPEALSRAGLSAEVMPVLRLALRDRHRLIHHFFWDRAAEFMSAEGCHRMLEDLTQMEERFRDCDARVEAEIHRWAAGHGITTDDFDAVRQAMLERGRVLSEVEVGEIMEPRRRAR